LQHFRSCKAINVQDDRYGGLQDVPLIPLRVLLGNPLYSSAKVGVCRVMSTYACSTCFHTTACIAG
jgi:hypothetical protein